MAIRRRKMSRLQPNTGNCSRSGVFQRFPNLEAGSLNIRTMPLQKYQMRGGRKILIAVYMTYVHEDQNFPTTQKIILLQRSRILIEKKS